MNKTPWKPNSYTQQHLTFYEADTVAVKYESNIKNASLWTLCWEGDYLQTRKCFLTLRSSCTPNTAANVPSEKIIQQAKGMSATELVLIDFHTTSDYCWFNIRDDGANSVRFSISEDQRSKTILGVSSAAPTSTQSSTSSVATNGGTTTTPAVSSSSAAASSPGGLSTGAKAGLGFGISLGVLGLAALVGVFYLPKKRKGQTHQTPPAEKAPLLGLHGELESPGPNHVAELPL